MSYFFADRKKDIVKLQMGEYLSLGKIESLLKTSALIENICIYAESTKTYCVALIVPQRENLTTLAEKTGIKNKHFEQLCDDKTVIKAVLKELAEHGKTGKFKLNIFYFFFLESCLICEFLPSLQKTLPPQPFQHYDPCNNL